MKTIIKIGWILWGLTIAASIGEYISPVTFTSTPEVGCVEFAPNQYICKKEEK